MKLLAMPLLLVSLTCISYSYCDQQESQTAAKATESANAKESKVAVPMSADDLFLTDYDEAVRKANETGKPIFIYVFDSV